MAPSNLQGLNIVHPAPSTNPYLSDQDLLSVPPFHDLSAQLDLWTNLNFQSDEPLIPKDRHSAEKRRDSAAGSVNEEDSDKYNMPTDEDLQNTGKIAETASHENVVTGTIVPPPTPVQQQHQSSGVPQLNAFDIGSLLASFGMDPFHVNNSLQMPPPPAPNAASAAVPSLAQLLSYHAGQNLSPLSISNSSSDSQSPSSTTQTSSASASSTTSHPAPKRARTSRSMSVEQNDVSEPASPEAEKYGNSPMNAAEDKRRRNTAASARFRLKKKEREAALEKKAKELEVRVSELEKECEALRRENGWLKGLVVGVTGAGAVQQQQQQTGGGVKRGREDEIKA
ncbi:hypothetical protein BDY19DRAFT_952510 [Irpex rosettiformis]|uniref:Uncharacterized protein n=1 Tax=Irpex rosettiformis TaxID=378272 RepID=A0ACB8U1Q8_9APHY|nr:hypothetical protein BDY19DRAFT_952510 [Irpex rosettiformis]